MQPIDHIRYAQAAQDLIASPNARVREAAAFECCIDVVKRVGEYKQAEPPEQSRLIGSLRRMGHDDLREALTDKVTRLELGKWRADVTDHEAAQAARLGMLAWVVRVLLDVRHRSPTPEIVDAQVSVVGDWVRREWRTAVPLSGDAREWSVRMTRRFDLLPKHWRNV